MEVELIKIYDEKGRTVLKKRILEHLGARKGSLIIAELRSDGTVLLKPYRREELLIDYPDPSIEEEVLKALKTAHYEYYETKSAQHREKHQ